MNLFENAYDYISETVSHEPNYVKLAKWAISVHFNSGASVEGDQQTPMPSRIGYYFSTIRFKNWVANYEPEVGKFAPLALFYDCNYKTFVGKQEVEDNRKFTIVYAVGDIDGLKDEIRENPVIAKCFAGDEPAPTFNKELPAELHRIAEEHVFYAKFYWKNDEQDALIIGQSRLHNLGSIIKNSEFATGKTEIFRDRQARGKKNDFRHDTGLYTTLPLSQKREFLTKISYPFANAPYVEVKVKDDEAKDGFRTIHGPRTGYSEVTMVEDPNTSRLYIGVSPDTYGTAIRYKMEQEGFCSADDWKEVSLMNSAGTGVKKVGIGTTALKETLKGMISGDLSDSGRKVAKKNGEAAPRATGPVTFACDSASFARITQMANRMVAAYNSEHKTTAVADVNSDNESITLSGLSAKALEQFTEILDKRGMKYSKM